MFIKKYFVKDKRKGKRLPAEIIVDITSLDGTDKRGRARVANISMGGVGVVSMVRFDVGAEVRLMFTLPGNRLYIFASCKIRRVKAGVDTFSYGIKFRDLEPEDKKRLKEIIAEVKRG
ncbi:PilZ domain-containing protein [Elusimicrobiota bacterium]